jgi:hypothetical protein
MYALSNYDPMNPGDAGNANLRITLSDSTTLGSLPSDFQALLNADGNQKTDDSSDQGQHAGQGRIPIRPGGKDHHPGQDRKPNCKG